MTVTASSVYWKGLLIGHLAQEHEPFALSSESRTLDWPLDRITNVNSKEVDERAFITFTMDEQFFIQIGCTTALQAAKYRTVIRGYLHNLKQPSLTAIESLDAPGTLATVPVPASIRQAIVLEAERSKQAAIERRDRSITLAQELYHTELERIESGLRGILQVIDKQDDQNVSHTHLTQAVPGETVASKSDATLNECQLCYDGLEKYALQPCSHRMCHTCMTKVQESSLQCPWDRVEIAGIIELPP
ncbi:hypothetical protein BC832DRAFT_376807 [Gaertneriomyces semiglobifer]|nr:hypothetical protein BC832DRAFT_376807 [Gaertneriomyces semiglobifer]